MVFTGERESQERICNALIQDLLEFDEFELSEYLPCSLGGPHSTEKAEHMLFSRGTVSILCSKFSGLPNFLASELANYHYVFVMGYRNTKTLEAIETIGENLDQMKSEDCKLPHVCLLNANKGMSNDAFEFFI